jgi:hypothetical protein
MFIQLLIYRSGAAKMIGAATTISMGTRKRELVQSHTMIT